MTLNELKARWPTLAEHQKKLVLTILGVGVLLLGLWLVHVTFKFGASSLLIMAVLAGYLKWRFDKFVLNYAVIKALAPKPPKPPKKRGFVRRIASLFATEQPAEPPPATQLVQSAAPVQPVESALTLSPVVPSAPAQPAGPAAAGHLDPSRTGPTE